jgi:hypothetical protein
MARWSERSSAALSTKWNNLHRNFYHLQGITEKQNELFFLSTPIRLKGIFLCTWLHNAFSSSTVVSNHMLSLLQSGEPLLYCIVVLAASHSYVVLSAATSQCPQTYSKHTNLTPTDEFPVTFLFMPEFTTKRFLSMCVRRRTCSVSPPLFCLVIFMQWLYDHYLCWVYVLLCNDADFQTHFSHSLNIPMVLM